MKIIVRVIVTAFTLLLVAEVVPGIEISGLWPALFAAILLGTLNAFVRPFLIFLTFPITLLTLGLFIFVINAALFLLVARFIDGFSVSSFWVALFGSVIVSIISSLINRYVK